MNRSKIAVKTIKHDKLDPPKVVEVQFYLKEYTIESDGLINLTPKCVNEEEVDYWIDSLIRELKSAKSDAKSILNKSGRNSAKGE